MRGGEALQQVTIEKIVYFIVESFPHITVTFTYVFCSLIFGVLIGVVIAKMRMSKKKILIGIADLYTTITRCTPSIVLLFLVFYGLPAILKNNFGIDMDNVDTIFFVSVTFSIFIGASSSEIIRSSYEAVNSGQREAGLSAGLSEFQTFYRIIFPQMLKNAIPNIGNTIIFLVKEGSLAYTIGLQDVLGRAYFLSARDVNAYALNMYIALTLIYWPIAVLLEKLFTLLEKKLTPERKKRKKEETNEFRLSIHS